MPGFGRRIEFDDRSRGYPVRALLAPGRTLASKDWSCERHLDQGNVGACVGFSWCHELIAEPELVPDITTDYAMMIYHDAQRLDEWPGEEYDGTSVLAGAKAIMLTGWLQEYRWAFGLQDLLETLSSLGPVILGINWYEGMLDTDPDGFVSPTGQIVGGHAILATGVDVVGLKIRLHNSWGPHWGINGDCFVTWQDMDKLLHEYGEACVPVVRTHVEEEPIEPEPVEPEPIEPIQPGCLPDILSKVKRLFR